MRMKKILLFALFTIVMCACSKDDEPKTFSLIANVSYNGMSAYPSIVFLYDYEEAKDFDKSSDAIYKFGEYGELYSASGVLLEPLYTSPTLTGVNTFENVSKGKYMVVAFYKRDGFTWPMFYYYGYTVLDLTYNLQSVKFNFRSSTMKAGEFIEF